jgi:hypothetical protein
MQPLSVRRKKERVSFAMVGLPMQINAGIEPPGDAQAAFLRVRTIGRSHQSFLPLLRRRHRVGNTEGGKNALVLSEITTENKD